MSAGAVRWRARALGAAIGLFVALVTAAMVVYRGGSHFDPLASHYAVWGNYLSDLGEVGAYAGRDNTLPRALFGTACLVIGVALAATASVWRVWDPRGRAAATDTAVVSAVGAGVAFAVVGVAPQDRVFGLHVAAVDAAFLLLLGFIGGLTLVQLRNRAPRALWVANAVAFVILTAYAVFVLLAGLRDPSTMRVAIAAQKLAIVVALTDVAIQVWAAGRLPAVAEAATHEPPVRLPQRTGAA